MTQREVILHNLRDTLDHLATHQQQLNWTGDQDTIEVLTDAMIRDLHHCITLCKNLRDRCTAPKRSLSK